MSNNRRALAGGSCEYWVAFVGNLSGYSLRCFTVLSCKIDLNMSTSFTTVATTVAAGSSAFAAIAAATVAFLAFRHQNKLENNKLEFLKLEVTLRHLQELIVTFAEIRAISETAWSDDRSQQLARHACDLRKSITIIGSLHPKSGNRLDSWRSEKCNQGISVSSVVDHELGQIGADIGDKYNRFFCLKSGELRDIQDKIFEEFSA